MESYFINKCYLRLAVYKFIYDVLDVSRAHQKNFKKILFKHRTMLSIRRNCVYYVNTQKFNSNTRFFYFVNKQRIITVT